jgi:hypothetical protein
MERLSMTNLPLKFEEKDGGTIIDPSALQNEEPDRYFQVQKKLASYKKDDRG